MNLVRTIFSILLLFFVLGCAKNTREQQNIKNDNHFQFTYSVTVPHISTPFTTGEILVPIPRTNDYQVVHDVKIETNGSYEVLQEPEYNNKYAKILFSDSLQSDINLTVVIDITRKIEDNYITQKKGTVEQTDILKRFLQADSLVPIDGVVASAASALVADSMTTIEKAQAFYDNLYKTMQYDKSGEGWGRGDALYACDIRKGNCTDFHSLFIGMARSVGIPARFLIGFPTSPEKDSSVVGGYHCWAEFYDTVYGWVPVDISEAVQNPEKKEFLFGNLDNDRLMFSVGRDIKILTDSGEKSFNFFIYPQVFIDGKPYNNFIKKFEFKKL
ncbi:MAG TPA: transglutaminase domain-containing protein [candidate division Zixibacteria bacterium]|nr:transglutaminase domain-containing protein [candidate division Zixibacteria bacterium]